MNSLQYLGFIVYLFYVVIFVSIILVIRHIYYFKIYGISPKEVNKRLREKGISRLRLALAPFIGKYYILPGKTGLKYEILKIFIVSIFMACYMGMVAPLLGIFIDRPLLSVWNVPLVFTYTFIIFFLIGLPVALYNYYLIKSGRAEEI